jgi:hypothetical protein
VKLAKLWWGRKCEEDNGKMVDVYWKRLS